MNQIFIRAIGLPTCGALLLSLISIPAADSVPVIIDKGPNHRTYETSRRVPTIDGGARGDDEFGHSLWHHSLSIYTGPFGRKPRDQQPRSQFRNNADDDVATQRKGSEYWKGSPSRELRQLANHRWSQLSVSRLPPV